MEDIPELLENSSQGTDEFGTGGGSKCGSFDATCLLFVLTSSLQLPA